MAQMRLGVIALLLVVSAPAAFAQAAQEARAATEVIMQQLEAFRREDYDTAYTFASEEIRALFDRQAFERMVKSGYPEIARSTAALVGQTETAPDGHVYIRLRIRGSNGNSIEALYDMVWEDGRWRINGVATRPAAGLVSHALPRGRG